MFGMDKKIEGVIYVIILIIVAITLIANSMPNLVTAFTNLSGSGIGFSSFFQAGGLVYMLLGAAVLILAIKLIMSLTHMGGKK